MKKTSDLLDILNPQKSRDYFPDKVVARSHTFYLGGNIGTSEDYIEWFETIRSCTQNDTITIHINSYGGDLFTAIQMMRVLSDTQATVITSVEGACMSAATMVFLCGDGFEVSPHSMFMFHNYSGGTFGKGGEMFEQLKHERTWSEKLMRAIYKDFLTEDEIQSMLDNKDIWMDGEEVIERLEERVRIIKEQREKEEAESEESDSDEIN